MNVKLNLKKFLKAFLMIFLGFLFAIIFVAILLLLLIRFAMTESILPTPTLQQIENSFETNKEEFSIIVEYLANLDVNNLGVSRDSPSITDVTYNYVELSVFREDRSISITDKNVSEAIHTLFEARYRGIWKYEYGIVFTRWGMRDHVRGIVYSIDDSIPDSSTIFFLTELHPLSEGNWFIFIENFNDYRRGIRPNLVEE